MYVAQLYSRKMVSENPEHYASFFSPRASYKWVKVGIGPVEGNMHNEIQIDAFYQGSNGRKLAEPGYGK